MPISVTCDECDKKLTLADRFAGKRVKCPKCEGPIDVPADDEEVDRADPDDRPAPRKRSRPRDEEDERPRARKAARDVDEDDDRPRKRRDPDEDEDRPRSKKPSKKQKQGKGGGMLLWLGLGGVGVLVLGGVAVAALYLLGVVGGGLGSEAKYLPDDCDFISSERVDQMRKTRYYEALMQKMGDLAKLGVKSRHGVKEEDVDRVTTGQTGMESVTIITSKKAIKAEDVKDGMKVPMLKELKLDFSEEKVGGYVLYVLKSGGVEAQAFCIPESRILVFGAAATLRKILKRDKRPDFSEGLNRAYADADFSATKVIVGGSRKAGAGGMIGGGAKGAEAMLMQVSYGSTVTTKTALYYKDAESAEEGRKEAEESLKKESIFGGEAQKEMRKNASISRSGSKVKSSTYVSEQTMIDDLNRKK